MVSSSISSSNSCLKRPFCQSRCSTLPPDVPRVTDQEPTCLTIARASTENVPRNCVERANFWSSKRRCSRPISLDCLPLEINIMVLSKLTSPPDVVRFSHTCSLFRSMANARVWCRLYKILVPHWSKGVEVDHVQGGVDVWRRIVMDDYMRKKLHWVPKSFESEFGMFIHDDEVAVPQLRINLDYALTIRPQYLDTASEVKWRNMGPPVSSTVSETKSTITAYVQALCLNGHTEYRIVMFDPSQHETPLAIIPSEFWTQSVGGHSDSEPQGSSSVAQLMDIKQYPDQKDAQQRIRVVLVLAFGNNNGVERLADGEGQMNILDTWTFVKVVELFVCLTASPFPAPPDAALAGAPRLIPYCPSVHKGRVRTFWTNSLDEVLRGRAIKVYTVIDPVTKEPEERIAFFGIRSTASQTVLLTSPLFGAPGKAMSNPPKTDRSMIKFDVLGDRTTGHSLETSCLALFPPQSDFENLVVIMDPQGRGEIWDWMNIKKVATLEIAGVERRQKQDQGIWTIQSNCRHFETSTLGTTRKPIALALTLCSTESESNAGATSEEYDLLFVAYLVWDHFRISLTSRFGLCIVDMDKEVEGDVLEDSNQRPPQYVTVLDNAAEDGLYKGEPFHEKGVRGLMSTGATFL
ncbi:hypothetical protein BGZ68_010114 [Mortierella alpina]|nr:hypothetical protein BGZ68_010114 [Mortierella alpina]